MSFLSFLRKNIKEKEIVYIFEYFPWYSHTFIFQEIRGLKEHGHRVRIITLRKGDRKDLHSHFADLWDDIEPIGSVERDVHIKNYRYCMKKYPGEIEKLRDRFSPYQKDRLSDLFEDDHLLPAFTVARHIERRNVGYLHSHFASRNSTLTYIVSQLFHIPRGMTCHVDHLLPIPYQLLKEQIEDSAVVFAISEKTKQDILKSAGERNFNKIIVKRNGIDLNLFQMKRYPKGLPGRLVSVARMDPKKGYEYLMSACAILKQRGYKFQCDLIGGGMMNQDVSRAVEKGILEDRKRYSLEDEVRLLGKMTQEEIVCHLPEYSIFVAPYIVTESGDMDGIPVSMVEAMAFGIVPVVTDVGGIGELVKDRVNGLIVPERDEKALADAVEKLMADGILYERLSKNARLIVEAEYDCKKTSLIFEESLKEILEI